MSGNYKRGKIIMYGCPNCGAELGYDIKTGKLKCSSCDGKYSVEEITKESDAEESFCEMNVFVCPSCGGEVYSGSNTIAGFCSYCGASVILQQRTCKMEAPKSIIPFRFEKKQCKTKFMDFAEKNRYVPKEYKEISGINEFRGIYIPYHMYEAEVDGVYHTIGRTSTQHRKSGTVRTDVKEWDVSAVVSGKVSGMTHDASRIFRDDLSEKINHEQDKSHNKKFFPGYLCGFYADMSDVPYEEYEEYAFTEAYEEVDRRIRSKTGSMEVKTPDRQPQIKIKHSGDVLKPVWFMSYRNRKRVAYAVINGMNGDMSCDLPVDMPKFFGISTLISAVIFLVLMLFQNIMFTAKTMIGIAALFNLLVWLLYNSNINKMYDREIKRTYKIKREKTKRFFADKRFSYSLIVIGFFLIPNLLTVLFVIVCVLFGDEAYIESGKFVKVAICLVTLYVQIFTLIKNWEKFKALKKNGTRPSGIILLSLIINLIMMAVAWINPVQDIWYYSVTALALAVIVLSIFGIISDYNLCCTRPMPQFEAYKGGQKQHELS